MSCMSHIWSLLKPLKFGYYGTNGYHILYPQDELKNMWEKTPFSKDFFSKFPKNILYYLTVGGRLLTKVLNHEFLLTLNKLRFSYTRFLWFLHQDHKNRLLYNFTIIYH